MAEISWPVPSTRESCAAAAVVATAVVVAAAIEMTAVAEVVQEFRPITAEVAEVRPKRRSTDWPDVEAFQERALDSSLPRQPDRREIRPDPTDKASCPATTGADDGACRTANRPVRQLPPDRTDEVVQLRPAWKPWYCDKPDETDQTVIRTDTNWDKCRKAIGRPDRRAEGQAEEAGREFPSSV